MDNLIDYTTKDLADLTLRSEDAVIYIANKHSIGTKNSIDTKINNFTKKVIKLSFNEQEKSRILEVMGVNNEILCLIPKKDSNYGDMIYATVENNGEVNIERYLSLIDATRLSGVKVQTWWSRIHKTKSCKGLNLAKNYILLEDFLKFSDNQPEGEAIYKFAERLGLSNVSIYNLLRLGILYPKEKSNGRRTYSPLEEEIVRQTIGKNPRDKIQTALDIYKKYEDSDPERFSKIICYLRDKLNSFPVREKKVKEKIVKEKLVKPKIEKKKTMPIIKEKIKHPIDTDYLEIRQKYREMIAGVLSEIEHNVIGEHSSRLYSKLLYCQKYASKHDNTHEIQPVIKACSSFGVQPLYFSNLAMKTDKLNRSELDKFLSFLVVLGRCA